MPDQSCVHIGAIATVKHPKRRECQECIRIGGAWFISVPVRNAVARIVAMTRPTVTRQSAGATGHAVIASAEPGERWFYCYPDDAFAEY